MEALLKIIAEGTSSQRELDNVASPGLPAASPAASSPGTTARSPTLVDISLDSNSINSAAAQSRSAGAGGTGLSAAGGGASAGGAGATYDATFPSRRSNMLRFIPFGATGAIWFSMGAGLVAYVIIITDAFETLFQTYYEKDPAFQDAHAVMISSWRELGLFGGWRNPLTYDYATTALDEAEVYQYDSKDMSKVISRRRLRAI